MCQPADVLVDMAGVRPVCFDRHDIEPVPLDQPLGNRCPGSIKVAGSMARLADQPDARGELIFRDGLPQAGVAPCSACHGADGRGKGQIPRVAGQHARYMIHQIKVLQQTEQRPHDTPLKQQLRHALSDADAESVARYMATLGARE